MKILALLLLLALLPLGAADAPEPAEPVITSDFVMAVLWMDRLFYETPITIMNCPEDAWYVLPTDADIQNLLRFYREHRQWDSYVPESWDCDNFAREFLYWSHVWGRKEWTGLEAQIAVGAAYVKINGDITDIFPGSKHRLLRGYHVLNVIFAADGKVYWFEPQTQILVPVESMLYEGSLEVVRIEM